MNNNNQGNFTNKAQDAIMTAQGIAQEKSQQQIDALHLLLALLFQEGSVVITILQKLGVDIEALRKKVENQVLKIPNSLGPQAFGQLYLTQDMAKVLDRARQESLKMGDEFISLNGKALNMESFQSVIGDFRENAAEGDPFEVVVMRKNDKGDFVEKKLSTVLVANESTLTNVIRITDNPTNEQLKLREAWLDPARN